MMTRWNKTLAAGAIGLLLVGCSIFTVQHPYRSDVRLPRLHSAPSQLKPGVSRVTVARVKPDSATLTWRSPWPGSSSVLYGRTPLLLPDAATRSRPTDGQEATLANLQPGTRYYFQVETETPLGVARSPVCSFLTR
jgi:hypothetical protein